ncbi:GDP-mannose 4,6-dehydratase [Telmatocola sphagniphila]|uniref:GDP-mannose 4,6-dehydratase n=1 Tax=Telmatocola sphagniphila TaxID=1123043 RepID=A0A8E6EVF7_9BACT|nr:GDP-mannose 4,6-dehydratase [Telmatocola sphagniphila]QVL32542.1 GDP-mannose 4,6-dehydratase [Telmatocola sphagniphila]
MKNRVLVTGGAGFIGSHLVDALVAADYNVRVLDDLNTGLADNLKQHGDRIEFQLGSICDSVSVDRAVQGVDTVYHLAALASVARSVENPLLSFDVCATGTLKVLDSARRASVKRVVFAASSSAYGGSSNEEGQREDQELSALSPYAAGKLASEYLLESFANTYGIETVRLRFFNIFGPRQRADSPYSGVIAIFAGLMSQGKVPVVHGDGLQSRDFTYVGNAVQALVKAGTVPGVSGRVYNVGTGACITIIDLVNALNKLLGTNITPKFGETRVGDVRFSRADITRIRAELNYIPNIDFETGLQKTLEWYRESK